jgi:hypothetical protein
MIKKIILNIKLYTLRFYNYIQLRILSAYLLTRTFLYTIRLSQTHLPHISHHSKPIVPSTSLTNIVGPIEPSAKGLHPTPGYQSDLQGHSCPPYNFPIHPSRLFRQTHIYF